MKQFFPLNKNKLKKETKRSESYAGFEPAPSVHLWDGLWEGTFLIWVGGGGAEKRRGSSKKYGTLGESQALV